jgi:hypothetical protein
MVEKFILNYLATALEDIPPVSMPIAHALNTFVILFCVKKMHILEWPFIVPQHKVHLCNDHAV